MSDPSRKVVAHEINGGDMCEMCNNPDATAAGVRTGTLATIEKSGWMIQYVEAGDDGLAEPSFAYTVGLTGRGHPELLIAGLDPPTSARVLNTVARSAGDVPLNPGLRLDNPPGCPLEVVRVDAPGEILLAAAQLYGPGVEALQLVYPDDDGGWPWDVHYRADRWPQPLYGLWAGPA